MFLMRDTVPIASETPVIDTSAGLLSTGGDSELLDELVSIFLQTTPAQLAKMKAATAAGDSTTARLEAHSLKGAAGTLGANGIRELAEDIEVLASRGTLETTGLLIASLERLLTQLKKEYAAD